MSASRHGADSGLDAEQGVIINGGSFFFVGSSMDMASTSNGQPTMNLIFNSNVATSSTVTVKDSSGNEIINYCANNAEFMSRTERRTYLAAVVSHPSFKLILFIICIWMEFNWDILEMKGDMALEDKEVQEVKMVLEVGVLDLVLVLPLLVKLKLILL